MSEPLQPLLVKCEVLFDGWLATCKTATKKIQQEKKGPREIGLSANVIRYFDVFQTAWLCGKCRYKIPVGKLRPCAPSLPLSQNKRAVSGLTGRETVYGIFFYPLPY